jgi:hypothetical protein
MPSVLLSVNVVVTESVTLPSATIGKDVFAECPTKKQPTKSRITVVHDDSNFTGSCLESCRNLMDGT